MARPRLHPRRLLHRADQRRQLGFPPNTVENFFSIYKRGVIGTYHHMSECHLHRYTAEFDFRYNTRLDSDQQRADKSLLGIAGKRLTYRRTNAIAA